MIPSLRLFFSISQHRISSVAINESGDWLAFGSSSLGQLLVWEWQSETYVLKQQGHFYDMNCLAYSTDGQLVATGGDDGKVCLCSRLLIKDSYQGFLSILSYLRIKASYKLPSNLNLSRCWTSLSHWECGRVTGNEF